MLDEALTTAGTYLGGLPVENVKGYLLGAAQWISPAIKTAYEDWLKTADKSGLRGLTGEALETRVSDILENRMGETDDAAAAELARLYAAGFKGAVPTDTPSSVAVDGENVSLSAYERQFYDRVWADNVRETLGELVDSGWYERQSDETREKAIKKLYDLAAERAKAEVAGREVSAWVQSAREAERAGVKPSDYIRLYVELSGVTGDRDENGKTVQLSASKKKKQTIDSGLPNLTEEQRELLYEIFGVSQKVWADQTEEALAGGSGSAGAAATAGRTTVKNRFGGQGTGTTTGATGKVKNRFGTPPAVTSATAAPSRTVKNRFGTPTGTQTSSGKVKNRFG